jgi:hypothetical protein
MGNFEKGGAGRGACFYLPSDQFAYRQLPQRLSLRHDSVAGKTILIHANKGLDDTIQHARSIPQRAARGARVILAGAPRLVA